MRVLPKIFQSRGSGNSIRYLVVITRSSRVSLRGALKFVAIRSVLQRKIFSSI